MATPEKNPKFSFTQSFKSTIQRYESLSEGKKADYTRSSAKKSVQTDEVSRKQKIAS